MAAMLLMHAESILFSVLRTPTLYVEVFGEGVRECHITLMSKVGYAPV